MMQSLFSKAKLGIEFLQSRACTITETRDLIFDLGKEALEENGNWVMLHRERPISPPM